MHATQTTAARLMEKRGLDFAIVPENNLAGRIDCLARGAEAIMSEGDILLEELVRNLDDCSSLVGTEPARALKSAREAVSRLDQLKGRINKYRYRNIRMRVRGVLGSALLSCGRIDDAAEVLLLARTCRSAIPAERATLSLRLARLYTIRFQLHEALREADSAVRHFSSHPPRPAGELRSLASALTAISAVLVQAYASDVKLSGIDDIAGEAESGFREALKVCTPNTPRTALVAVSDLGALSVQIWWQEGLHKGVSPKRIAADMKSIYRRMRRLGIVRKSVVHAKVRWLDGLATAEAFGWLNRAAEGRLQNALDDLIDLESISNAAQLCLDMSYLYLREDRWADVETVTAAVLCHANAQQMPKSWYEAFMIWQKAIEEKRAKDELVNIFEKIRGIKLANHLTHPRTRIPKYKYGNRDDTMGF